MCNLPNVTGNWPVSTSVVSLSASLLPPAAFIYCADSSKPRLVRGCGQCWPVRRWPLERERVTEPLPVRCRNRQRIHLLLSKLWNHPTGQNYTGASTCTKNWLLQNTQQTLRLLQLMLCPNLYQHIFTDQISFLVYFPLHRLPLHSPATQPTPFTTHALNTFLPSPRWHWPK